MGKRGMTLYCLLLLVLLGPGCTGGEQTATPAPTVVTTPAPATAAPHVEIALTPKELFETKCSLCHSLDDPRSVRRSYDGWLSTVRRMIGNGAPLTDEEAEVVAGYLAETYGKE